MNVAKHTPTIQQLLAMRVDGPDKVTGRSRYAGDIVRTDMLWGKVLRSPLPHARIVAIDVSEASALAGVRSVLTGLDLPDLRVGRMMRDMPILARERVRFVGEKVAAVAAEDPDIADQACSLLRVEYEELPAVFDPHEAMREGAPEIHSDTDERFVPTARRATCRNGISHAIAGCSQDEVEQALAAADHVFEHTFQVPLQHQGYIEPHACMVETHADGTVDVWASQKAPFLMMDYLRLGMRLRDEDVRLNLVPVGGDFGGKGSLMDVSIAYFLSKATGRPVKMIMSYAEELAAGAPRHFGTLIMRTGVQRDGTLVARHVRHVYASGAYAAMKPMPDVNLPLAREAAGHYNIPHVRTESLMVYTNTVHSGHMRSPGGPQPTFAGEAQLDAIARALGIDPLEMRLRNAPGAGHHQSGGEAHHGVRAVEALQAAAKAIDWHAPRPPFVGKGLSLGVHGLVPFTYSAEVEVLRDGRIVLRTALPEVGVGSHTALRLLVARELGVPPETVEVLPTMGSMTTDRGSSGSMATRIAGTASRIAGQRVRERLAEAVAREFDVAASDVMLRDGCFQLRNGTSLSLAEAVALADGPVVEVCSYRPEKLDVHGWFAQAVEVEIDPETGQVQVLRAVTVHDVGEILNPVLHQGQIDGAAVQGLGVALMERLQLQDGRVVNPHLGEYKIPSIADLPPLTTVLLPPDLEAGIKPIGEGANNGILAAIANAVASVTGVCPTTYPIHPEQVLAMLRQGREKAAASAVSRCSASRLSC